MLHSDFRPTEAYTQVLLQASPSPGLDANAERIACTRRPFLRWELPMEAKPVYNAAQFAVQNCYLLTRERGSAIMKRNVIRLFLTAAAAAFLFAAQTRVAGQTTPSAQHKAQPPRSVRLYVFDCGVLHNADMGRFNLKKEDVATTD